MRRPSLAFIFISVAIDLLGIGLLIPVMPVLVGTMAGSKQVQSWWFGALTLTFGVAQFLSAPLLGAMSDRFGRRPVLLISIFGLGTAYFVIGLSHTLWLLLAARVVSGSTSAAFSVASAYVADITPPEKRAQGLGLLGAAFGIGFILGPAIGGIVGSISLRAPFFLAATLCLLNGLYGLFVLPESLPPEKRSPITFERANPVGAVMRLARLRGIGVLVVAYCASMLAQLITQTGWVLYAMFRFGWTPRENGVVMLFVGASAGIIEGALLGKLVKLFGEKRLAVIAMVSSIAGFVGYGLAMQPTVLYVVIAVTALSFAGMPILQALISRAAKANAQGSTQGALQAINSLMIMVAPVIATPLLAFAGKVQRTDWRMGTIFLACAVIQTIALVALILHFRRPARVELEPQAGRDVAPPSLPVPVPLQPARDLQPDEIRFEDVLAAARVDVTREDFSESSVVLSTGDVPVKPALPFAFGAPWAAVAPPPDLPVDPAEVIASAGIFAGLTKEALDALSAKAEIVEFMRNATVCVRNERAYALYVIVAGMARVIVKDGPTVRLGEGDVFGEGCLLDQGVRQADVQAETELVTLRIAKKDVEAVAAEHAGVGDTLFQLFGRRLVMNLMHSSPLFSAFEQKERFELAKLFETRRASRGMILVEKGKRSDGLYVLLAGHLEAEGAGIDGVTRVARRSTFGHVSLFAATPAEVTVRAVSDAVLLRLPASKFSTLATLYPPVLAYLAAIAEEPLRASLLPN